MRAYHFLSAANALDDLTRRQIKISEIDKLNDPFELWCSSQESQQIRVAMRLWKQEMARIVGIICFCKRWRNPVLWSHYADRHRGICLGFDLDDKLVKTVRYVKERTLLPLPPTQEAMDDLLFTKYWDWAYEEELRGWFKLDQPDEKGNYFYPFDEKVRLREVIAGPLCETSFESLEKVITSYRTDVSIIKARLAFRSFEVVENQQGFARLR